MSEITPEERRRIYEDEKASIEAEKASPQRKQAERAINEGIGCLAVLAIIGGLILYELLPHSRSPEPVVAIQGQETIEYKLAVINHGGYLPTDDLSVRRFRYLLEELGRRTGRTDQYIGDTAVVMRNYAREVYGRDLPLIDLMESANKLMISQPALKYEEALALIVTVTGQ